MKINWIIFLFVWASQIMGQVQPQTFQAMDKLTTVPMTPEILWQLDRLSPMGISTDENGIVYKVSTPKMTSNNFSTRYFMVNLKTGLIADVEKPETLLRNKNISPDGKYMLSHKAVPIEKIKGSALHPDLPQTSAQVYDALGHRHWDTWTDGSYNHVMLTFTQGETDMKTDIMANEPYHCPQLPFGGDEDYIWHPDGKSIVYVCKKKSGKDAMISTNTDLYRYFISNGETKNLTSANKGYDTHPLYNSKGQLAYLSMKTDGYEADKQDIIVMTDGKINNLTKNWDGTVNSFMWSQDENLIYFAAPVDGTVQIFSVSVPASGTPEIKMLTKGDWDVTNLIGEVDGKIYVTRTDMNTAPEIFSFDLKNESWKQITNINAKRYGLISKSKIERRYVTTTDNKQMLVWVIYPPDFDPKKKYPTLLYCQGGPQSHLSQFYSFRWNFQLMAAQGYIVVAPNRRGMPGFGVEWNQQISKDWGGQNIQDYLTAIDEVSKEPFVDKKRRAAVGASYGGYSVFYLAGVHDGRFSSFISHCGSFNTQSMYGSTEELFFVNYDFGGPYWENKDNKTYTEFNPASKVDKWNTPIMIIQGEKDYRIPMTQALEAFTAAQVRGIKSRLLYLPDENHWVMKPQNGLLWQREFFKWLKETL